MWPPPQLWRPDNALPHKITAIFTLVDKHARPSLPSLSTVTLVTLHDLLYTSGWDWSSRRMQHQKCWSGHQTLMQAVTNSQVVCIFPSVFGVMLPNLLSVYPKKEGSRRDDRTGLGETFILSTTTFAGISCLKMIWWRYLQIKTHRHIWSHPHLQAKSLCGLQNRMNKIFQVDLPKRGRLGEQVNGKYWQI